MKKIVVPILFVFPALSGLALLFSFMLKHEKNTNETNFAFTSGKLEKSLSFIEGCASFRITPADMDFPFGNYDKDEENKVDYSVNSFYISKTEVSNGEYLAFLNDLKTKNPDLYLKMLPDTSVWNAKKCFALTDYYFRHPLYANYPVVGVSYEQASAYCEWLTEIYSHNKKRKFEHAVFFLPTLRQWDYAASGSKNNSTFPWNGYDLQDKKGKWMANFKIIPQFEIGRLELNADLEKKNSIDANLRIAKHYNREIIGENPTVPVKSLKAHTNGLYHMAGNVEEMLREKGICKGGSFDDPGYYLRNYIHQVYDSGNWVSSERGFRFVMEIPGLKFPKSNDPEDVNDIRLR